MSEEYQYPCSYCKLTYSTIHSLSTHLRSSHLEISNDRKKKYLDSLNTTQVVTSSRLFTTEKGIKVSSKKKNSGKEKKKRVWLTFSHFESNRRKH